MPQPLRFVASRRTRELQPCPGEHVAALEWIGWDDFGYRTTFKLSLSVGGLPFQEIGEWKILNTTEREVDPERWSETRVITEVPPAFEVLPSGFASVGQDLNSYEALFATGRDLALRVLGGLRDVVVDEPSETARAHRGFDTSLLRFTSARQAFEARDELRSYGSGLLERPETVAFEVSCRLRGFSSPHRLSLSFSRRKEALGLERLVAVVGRNGTGKTQLLASLAHALSGLTRDAEVQPRPAFRQVIAVSYGAWDQFIRPGGDGGRMAYRYFGLRADSGDDAERLVLDVPRAHQRAIQDLLVIAEDGDKRKTWLEALRSCGIEGKSLLELHSRPADARRELSHRGSGEQVAVIVLTHLVCHVVPDTLVLIDEPEVHTHPQLLSGMLRALNQLLVDRDAFALLATHSPIPLQEIPGRSVLVMDLIDGHPKITPLGQQSFGATLDEILAVAFRTRQDERNWASFLQTQIREAGRTAEEVLTALAGDPSLGVRVMLAALESEANDDAADV